MAVLKSYTCSKCAGVLNFDSDQEFFDCPFCGNHFDVVDFHEDEIMAQAQASLKQGAFSSAKEKFFAVLDKEPSNFEALKGLVLCELKATVIGNLSNPKIFDTVDVDSLKKLIKMAKKQSPENAEFFTKILGLPDINEKLKMYKNSGKALTSDTTKRRVDEGLAEARTKRIKEGQDYNPVSPLIVLIGVILAMLTLLFDDSGTVAIIVGVVAVFAAIFVEYEHNQDVIDSNPVRNSYHIKDQMDSQYNRYNKMYGTEFNRILELNRAAKARKPDAEVPAETKKETFIEDADHHETIICSKCAGQLYLDKERRVYECKSCGVAYGISLFFGMPLEKALNSMNTGRYDEAEQRFENILMVNPASFEAFLGKILCTGKWSRVSDIAATDVVSKEASDKFSKLFGDAKEKIPEADREFMVKFEYLLSMLGKISSNSSSLNELDKEIEEFESEERVLRMADRGSYGTWLQKKSRVEDAEALEKENRQMNHDFLALKRELIKMKIDCVLVK